MATMRMARHAAVRVTVGVDTHKDAHVARAKDQLGRLLGEKVVPTTPSGYRALLAWARSHGEEATFGVEGTGSYGAGLARHLRSEGHVVIEVIRPSRQARRRHGKSDPADADAAASAVLAGDATGQPKTADATVEMIRALRVARQTAIKARTQAGNAMKALVVTAPEDLRECLRELTTIALVRTCARLRAGTLVDPTTATKVALRSLALRHQALETETRVLEAQLARLTAGLAPELLAVFGVGTDSAGALLVAAGDDPRRLRSEAAFAMLCGASPVEASSGKVTRHRLNRGGDREANCALYHIVMVRLRWHQPTKDYMARRTTEGKSKREIIRCLKRYVAREAYAVLRSMQLSDDATGQARAEVA
jgi:transposase